MDQLKFVVLDAEDLAVVSAHLQDAVLKVRDVIWRPQEKRLVLALNRFDWESAQEQQFRRGLCALRFERVLSCKCKHVNPAGKDGILNLLAVEFEPTDAPAGAVRLTFSGDAVLRLDVECLEAELADLGPTWTTSSCPMHLDLEPAGKTAPAAEA